MLSLKKKFLNQVWTGFGNGRDGIVVIDSDTTLNAGGFLQSIQGVSVRVTNNAVVSTPRLLPIFIKALVEIVIDAGCILDADAKGFGTETNNIFGITVSQSPGQAGRIGGISTGGAGGGVGGLGSSGGQPLSVTNWLNHIQQESIYDKLLIDEQYNGTDICAFGGGGMSAQSSVYNPGIIASCGGGGIILSAPKIRIIGATLRARGEGGPQTASNQFAGNGGGGGGLIALFGNNLEYDSTTNLLANGGGGSGGSWGGVGTAGNINGNGGVSQSAGYSKGGAGGGSTALNADGGIPGAGGAGTQFTGEAGNIYGQGGAGGNATGSDRGGRGGAGGGAGKISWVQVDK